MIASIEGIAACRGRSRYRRNPVVWASYVINNVETLAHTVRVINEGAEGFRRSAQRIAGTKTLRSPATSRTPA